MVVSRLSKLPAFRTIGKAERDNVMRALKGPLSGYLGGASHGGYWVEKLADKWKEAFGVTHAIPCNSATSGLLAACMACGIGPGDEVWTTCYSMSATAACALALGAKVRFFDIEPKRFGLRGRTGIPEHGIPKALIVTNLFGHPAYLSGFRKWCDDYGVVMIEDNAQAPFAIEDGRYAGTIGYIGVFSLNVHKHLQSGEGGVVVTNDDGLAHNIHGAVNHGELDESLPDFRGLNLRMTEVTAAIACAQLDRAPQIIESRRRIAAKLTEIVKGIPWIIPPTEAEGCKHVYYLWAARVTNGRRKEFVEALQDRGLPIRAGYAPLLTRVFDSSDKCPVAEQIEDHEIVVYENCAYDPNAHHLRRMKDIIQSVANKL